MGASPVLCDAIVASGAIRTATLPNGLVVELACDEHTDFKSPKDKGNTGTLRVGRRVTVKEASCTTFWRFTRCK